MIRAAFFDIDDTILAHSIGRVPEDTLYALRALKEKGIRIFTSTGRHILELDALGLTKPGFDGYVLMNGQLCLDGSRRIVAELPVEREDIAAILPVFEEKQIALSFVELDRMYANVINDRVRTAQRAISSELPQIGSYRGAAVYLINVYAEDDTVRQILQRMPHCRMTRWHPFGVDIISREGGKEKGMEEILKSFGISREETIAFGDGENDMEMLQFAGVGVAMGNAEEQVKEKADYVTADADRGGILKALRHFHILS